MIKIVCGHCEKSYPVEEILFDVEREDKTGHFFKKDSVGRLYICDYCQKELKTRAEKSAQRKYREKKKVGA